MKKWYFWLILALIWALGGVINYFDGRSIASALVLVPILMFLGFAQLLCEKHGEQGKRVFRYITTTMLVLLIVAAIILFIIMFA